MLYKTAFLPILACLLLASLTVALGAQASSSGSLQQQTDGTASIQASAQEAQAALNLWTREARLAATPISFPQISIAQTPQKEPLSVGKPGSAPSGKPNPQAENMAKREFPDEWRSLAAESEVEPETLQPAGTAAIYNGYYANFYSQMWKAYPYKAIGKLYFSTSSGNATCTASVISSKNIIVTAAHCVWDYDNHKWYKNWVFVPADKNGAAPYGKFAWSSARVLNAYQDYGTRNNDVAVITLKKNSAGRPVTDYTGWLGRSWDYSYSLLLNASGYPSNLSSAKYSYICAAESFYADTDIIGMGCNMTYGSSGGPWIKTFTPYKAGSMNYVDAVVSGGTPGTDTFYGPRFSSNNLVPLCNAQGC